MKLLKLQAFRELQFVHRGQVSKGKVVPVLN